MRSRLVFLFCLVISDFIINFFVILSLLWRLILLGKLHGFDRLLSFDRRFRCKIKNIEEVFIKNILLPFQNHKGVRFAPGFFTFTMDWTHLSWLSVQILTVLAILKLYLNSIIIRFDNLFGLCWCKNILRFLLFYRSLSKNLYIFLLRTLTLDRVVYFLSKSFFTLLSKGFILCSERKWINDIVSLRDYDWLLNRL